MGIFSWIEGRRAARLAAEVSPAHAAARVQRGAAYLDEADPLWYFRIDPATLDLNHPGCCVLGQLHGDYRAGLFRADIVNAKSTVRASLSPVVMGFQAVDHSDESVKARDYDYLTEAWRGEVKKRLRNDAPAHRESHPRGGAATLDSTEKMQHV